MWLRWNKTSVDVDIMSRYCSPRLMLIVDVLLRPCNAGGISSLPSPTINHVFTIHFQQGHCHFPSPSRAIGPFSAFPPLLEDGMTIIIWR